MPEILDLLEWEFVFLGENSPFCKNKIVLNNMVKVVN
jgi:hypothetical protein